MSTTNEAAARPFCAGDCAAECITRQPPARPRPSRASNAYAYTERHALTATATNALANPYPGPYANAYAEPDRDAGLGS